VQAIEQRDVEFIHAIAHDAIVSSDAWAIGAALRPVIALQESAKRFPHIKVGEDGVSAP
jgi:hypothetical protein